LKKSEISIELVGGLGNQLFGFYAGLSIAEVRNSECTFDLSILNHGITNHGVSIESFNLPGKFEFVNRQPNARLTFRRRLNSYLYRRVIAKSFLLRTKVKTYSSTGVGFDPFVLLPSLRAETFRGYFQSWKYFESLPKEIKAMPPTLKNPSEWFITLEASASESMPIMMHVRRGDYAKLNEVFGMLDAKYYLAALDIAVTAFPGRRIWVISDDIDSARNSLLSGISKYSEHISWITPPRDSDPAESLLLLSKGSATIAANSTFSWWGAFLGGPERLVVFPSPAYSGMVEPQDFVPTHWTRVKSSWIDVKQ